MSGLIGSLRVDLGLDSAQFNAGLKKVKSNTDAFASAIKGVLGGMAAAFSVAAFAGMIRGSMEAIDAQAKLARAIGGTIGGMQSLERASSRSGVQTSEMTAAVTRLNQALGQAIIQGKGSQGVFKRLGVSAEELSRMDVDDRLIAVSEAMKRNKMSTQEMSATLRELGIRQSSMITLLQGGAEEIRKSRDAIRAYGAALTSVDASKIEAANDAIGEIGIVFQALRNRIAIALAPVMERFANMLTESAKEGGTLRMVIDGLVGGFHILAGGLNFVLENFNYVIQATKLFIGLQLASAALGIGRAMVALAHALRTAGLVMAAVHAIANLKLKTWLLMAGGIAIVTGQFEKLESALGHLASKVAGLIPESISKNLIGALGIQRFEVEDMLDGLSNSYEAAGGKIKKSVDKMAAEAARIFEATRTPLEAYQAQIARLNELLAAGAINQDTYNRAVIQAQDAFKKAEEAGKKTDNVFKQIGQSISSSFASAFQGLIDGSKRAGDVIKDLLSQLSSLLINQAFKSLVGGLFGSFGIPGFASGTNSAPRGFAIVGEKGPELVHFGGGEQVIPNHKLARGGEGPIINIIDNAGIEKRTERTRGPDGREMVSVILEKVKEDYATGGFDKAHAARFGSAPIKTVR